LDITGLDNRVARRRPDAQPYARTAYKNAIWWTLLLHVSLRSTAISYSNSANKGCQTNISLVIVFPPLMFFVSQPFESKPARTWFWQTSKLFCDICHIVCGHWNHHFDSL